MDDLVKQGGQRSGSVLLTFKQYSMHDVHILIVGGDLQPDSIKVLQLISDGRVCTETCPSLISEAGQSSGKTLLNVCRCQIGSCGFYLCPLRTLFLRA